MKPTKEQLAPNIDPNVRDYIDACIAEAIEKAKLSRKLQVNAVEATLDAINSKMENVTQVERQVRSHLGIYIQE